MSWGLVRDWFATVMRHFADDLPMRCANSRYIVRCCLVASTVGIIVSLICQHIGISSNGYHRERSRVNTGLYGIGGGG